MVYIYLSRGVKNFFLNLALKDSGIAVKSSFSAGV